MRLSVDPTDPGYDPIRGPHATVLFNGKPLLYVITADEEGGEIVRYVMASEGKFTRGPDNEPVRETLYGRVSILFMRS